MASAGITCDQWHYWNWTWPTHQLFFYANTATRPFFRVKMSKRSTNAVESVWKRKCVVFPPKQEYIFKPEQSRFRICCVIWILSHKFLYFAFYGIVKHLFLFVLSDFPPFAKSSAAWANQVKHTRCLPLFLQSFVCLFSCWRGTREPSRPVARPCADKTHVKLRGERRETVGRQEEEAEEDKEKHTHTHTLWEGTQLDQRVRGPLNYLRLARVGTRACWDCYL